MQWEELRASRPADGEEDPELLEEIAVARQGLGVYTRKTSADFEDEAPARAEEQRTRLIQLLANVIKLMLLILEAHTKYVRARLDQALQGGLQPEGEVCPRPQVGPGRRADLGRRAIGRDQEEGDEVERGARTQRRRQRRSEAGAGGAGDRARRTGQRSIHGKSRAKIHSIVVLVDIL